MEGVISTKKFLVISSVCVENGAKKSARREGSSHMRIAYTLSTMARSAIRFTIGQKLAIVNEAYAEPGNLYRVGNKYGVDWRNIKRWRARLLDCAEVDRQAKTHRPLPSIQAVVEGQDVWDHLRSFIEKHRELDHAVTGTMLFYEVRQYGFLTFLKKFLFGFIQF
jgi:hypothetical protein